jgi:hypothetical protein
VDELAAQCLQFRPRAVVATADAARRLALLRGQASIRRWSGEKPVRIASAPQVTA